MKDIFKFICGILLFALLGIVPWVYIFIIGLLSHDFCIIFLDGLAIVMLGVPSFIVICDGVKEVFKICSELYIDKSRQKAENSLDRRYETAQEKMKKFN